MKTQSKRKFTENQVAALSSLVIANQFTLDQLDEIKKMGFVNHGVKFHANRLGEEIEKQYAAIFKGAHVGTSEYYVQMVEFCKMQIRIFNHLYKLENQEKLPEFREKYTGLLESMAIIKPSEI